MTRAAALAILMSGCSPGTAPEIPTVVEPVSIAVAADRTILILGESQQLVAAVLARGGHVIPGSAVTWASEDPAVVGVSSTGVAVAVAPGMTRILARSGGLEGAVTLRAVESEHAAASVVIRTGYQTLMPGTTLQLLAEVRDASGGVLPGLQISWSSDNPAVIAVSPSGLATAASVGQAMVRAVVGSATALVALEVRPAPASHGEILFESPLGLEVIREDGTGRRVLVQDGRAGRWSVDGTKLLYLRGGSLHVAAGDGSGAAIVGSGYVVDDPAWVHEGRGIAYTRAETSFAAFLGFAYMAVLDVATLLQWPEDWVGTWSGLPQSATLRYGFAQPASGPPPGVHPLADQWESFTAVMVENRGSGNQPVIILGTAGGFDLWRYYGQNNVVLNASQPAWSSAGELAFVRSPGGEFPAGLGAQVWTIRLGQPGAVATPFLSSPQTASWTFRDPVWSLAGDRMAVSVTNSSTGQSLGIGVAGRGGGVSILVPAGVGIRPLGWR